MAVNLAVACDVFGGVLFCAVLFPTRMSWMRAGSELSQFRRIFQPTFVHDITSFAVYFCFQRKIYLADE